MRIECSAPWRKLLAAAIAASTLSAAAWSAEPAIDPGLRALVTKHLYRDPTYQPGDILSRGSVEPIFNEMIALNVYPYAGQDGVYNAYLRDGDYLVQLLRSPAGRKFMRKISRIPGAYDRLERLSWLPTGRAWLHQLIAAENGDELFAGLVTEAGMKKVAEMLGDDPRGQNFALPSGHVHTETQFLERLQHALEEAQRQKVAKEK